VDTRPKATEAAPAKNSELQSLLSAHLFGLPEPGNLAGDQLPLTSLNLELTGVMVRGADSLAVIRIGGSEETSIGIGQEIQAGATLYAVYPDRAVLRRAGILEGLMLKDGAPALPAGSILSPEKSSAMQSGIRGGGNQYTVDRDTMTQQMQRPEFLTQALVVPNAGGGFLVREIQPGSVYEKLGVRVGDVIRSVNGQAINNMEEVMKVYQQLGGLQQAGNVTLEVSRAGRTEVLHYSLQ